VKLLADALAVISAAFLAVPAWYFNKYAHLAARATLTRIKIADPRLAALYHDTLRELVDLRDGWKPWKALCLHIGTVAGLLATALALGNSVCEWLAARATH
jgi:hypothetical protein